MKTLRRLSALFLIVVPTMVLPSAAMAKPSVELLTKNTAAVTAGADAWMVLNWTASEDIRDFKVVATKVSSGATVDYPTNLGSWTGLMGGHELLADEIDFSAMKVSVPAGYSKKDVKVDLKVSYTVGGKATSDKVSIKVPVAIYTGQALSHVSTDATVAGGDVGWISMAFAGHAPATSDFSLVIDDPAGLVLSYPSGRSSTSFQRDARLTAGETDFAAVLVDATYAEPGEYTVTFTATYTASTGPESMSGTATITVTP